jgi:hypothetical protein
MEFVTWDDCSIPNCFWKVIKLDLKKNKVPVTTNQIISLDEQQISAFLMFQLGQNWR